MKPDRSIGDAIVDDVELERFIDWLCEHGHTPFSMSEHELKEVWLLGLQAWHLNKCKNGRIEKAAYEHHTSTVRQCQEMLDALAKGAKE